MITVKVNQKAKQTQADTTLQNLVNDLDIASHGIAIAINQQIISKINWNKQKLQNGDNILIIKATQGG